MRLESLEDRSLMASVVLDKTFSGDGIFTTNKVSGATAIAVQSNQMIVTAGGDSSGFEITRITPAGALDTSFGTGGIASHTIPNSTSNRPGAIAIQSDGKIVVAGTYSNGLIVARYTKTGALDTTFSGDGIAVASFAVSTRGGGAVAISGDGSIIVAGLIDSSDGGNFGIVRFSKTGVYDATFGKRTVDFSDQDVPFGIRFEGSKITVGGVTESEDGQRLASVRLLSSGALDTSYGSSGKKIEPQYFPEIAGFSGEGLSYSGAFIYSPGTHRGANALKSFGLVRGFTSGGTDSKFDGDGLVITRIGSSTDARAFASAVQSDGRVVVAGFAATNDVQNLTVVRYGVAPTISSFSVPSSAVEQRAFTLSANAYTQTTSNAVDGYQWFITGPGFSYTSTAKSFPFTPPREGTYDVRLNVYDAVGVGSSRLQTITVLDNAPTITEFTVPTQAVVTREVSFSAAATNAGSGSPTQTYQWSITGPGGFAETRSTAAATFTPPAIGTYTLTLTATDSLGGSVTRTQTVNVLDKVPKISRFIVPATANEGANTILTATAFEAGTSTPVSSYSWKVTGESFEKTFNTARAVVRFPDNGTFTAELTVTDQFGETSIRTATIEVANVAPTIKTMVVPANARLVTAVNLSASATDPAIVAGSIRDTLKFTWVITGPSNYRKVLTGTAPAWTSHFLLGKYTVKLTVSDDDGGVTTLTKLISLTAV